MNSLDELALNLTIQVPNAPCLLSKDTFSPSN